MDRVLLRREDVDTLFTWKDQHEDLVRTMPAPLRAVEIVVQANGLRIKGIRDGNKLTLYLYHETKSLGKMEFKVFCGVLIMQRDTTQLSQESRNSVVTGYCALMAYMVYEQPERIEAEDITPVKSNGTPRKTGNKTRTTYILRKRRETVYKGGHHASPKGIFTVRGHYRRYKSGKVVWINEFKKGEGNKKSKTYKLGTE